MDLIKDLKNKEITQGMAKNHWDTEVTSGNAPKSTVWDLENETGQYTTPGIRVGGKGGRNPSGKDGS